MAGLAIRRPAAGAAPGFTLVEALFAMLLLGACLVPATYALRAAVQGPGLAAGAAHNLDCVGTLMEQVLGTPYSTLYALANNNGPSAFTIPGDPADCPARQVTIQTYGNEVTKAVGPGGTSAYLLYVSVGLANPADGNPYTLTTLVSR